jgi:hypothetical protein
VLRWLAHEARATSNVNADDIKAAYFDIGEVSSGHDNVT